MIPMVWKEESGQSHSLPLCLRSLLDEKTNGPSYDTLLAALGIGSLSTAPKSSDQFDVLWGQEAFLPVTAALFGIRLRELHPRRTARGLDHSAEFPQHFIDSYIPLIARAHEVGQPTLVCRGWPPPHQFEWGLVTHVVGETLAGMTIGYQGAPIPLTGSPLFAYVVEEVQSSLATQLSPADQIARAAWIAVEQQKLADSPDAEFVTGLPAFTAWSTFCRGHSKSDFLQSNSFNRMIARWMDARHSMMGWLSKKMSHLDGPIREVATRWSDLCVNNTSDLGDPERMTGKLRYAELIDRVGAREAQLLSALQTIAKPISVRPAYEAAPLCI